jgi:hypothetical protein
VIFEYSLNREGAVIFRPLWTDILGMNDWIKKPSSGIHFRWSLERSCLEN